MSQYKTNLLRAANAIDKALTRIEYKNPMRYQSLLLLYYATLKEAGTISGGGWG